MLKTYRNKKIIYFININIFDIKEKTETHDQPISSSLNQCESNNQKLACRICLDKNEEDDNPFLSPCKCAGTMSLIHLKCLQRWLKSKNVIKQNNVSTTILIKTLTCELCKAIFPGQK